MSSSWRDLLKRSLSLNSSLPNAQYAQLATVRCDGTPGNRTIVFRGFNQDSELQFCTDVASSKVQEISQTPAVELCWYFPMSREQFRISGTMVPITSRDPSPLQHVRRTVWDSLSFAAKKQFLSITTLAESDETRARALEPTDSFCVLLLAPRKIDYLNLFDPSPKSTLFHEEASPL